MNYILEINEFYRWLESHQMPSCAVNLWHALMQINNAGRWKGNFTAALSTLCSKTGLDRKSVFKGREVLEEMGRIRWKSNISSKAAEYCIIPFFTGIEPGNNLPANGDPGNFPANRDLGNFPANGDKTTAPSYSSKSGQQSLEGGQNSVLKLHFSEVNNPETTGDSPEDADEFSAKLPHDDTPERATDCPTDLPPNHTPECGTDHGPINKLKENEKKINESNSDESEDSLSSADDATDPVQLLFDRYNEICKNLQPVKLLTERRRRMVGRRLKEYGFDNCMMMLHRAAESDFLAGNNTKDWTANFNWIFRPENFVKVFEGNYKKLHHTQQSANLGFKPSPIEVLEEAFNNICGNEDY